MMRLECSTESLGGTLHFDHPLREWNSWRVGGCSDCFYLPSGVDDLAWFLRHCVGNNPVTCIGLGSNLLVRDGGVRGVVISLRGGFEEIKHSGNSVHAQAGVTCARLARYCAEQGLAGLEFMVGVPGSVGGALAMNAGAFCADTWSRVTAVDVIGRDGQVRTRDADQFEVSYRSVKIADGEWFIGGYFSLSDNVDTQALKQKVKDLLKRRRAAQPVGQASCGCVFKNPDNGHAASLIEQCGLKEYAVGDAQVSAKHANFIINRGAASAAEIEALIRHVRAAVADETGVELQTEVRIIGEES